MAKLGYYFFIILNERFGNDILDFLFGKIGQKNFGSHFFCSFFSFDFHEDPPSVQLIYLLRILLPIDDYFFNRLVIW